MIQLCLPNITTCLLQAPKIGTNSTPIRKKNSGAADFAAYGLHVGNGMGCPFASHENFAMQIRLLTTSIYGNSGQLGGQLSRQPTASKYEKVGSIVGNGVGCEWAAHGNFATEIRLPTSSIYGDSWQLSGQRSWHANKADHYFHIWKQWAAQ